MVLQQLNINSLARQNYNTTTSSNFRINLANPLTGIIKNIRLKSATIPNTLYNIVSGVNFILIVDSSGNNTITVPPGNYTVSQFVAELQNQLNATSPDTYTVAYDNISGKITITSSFAGFQLLPSNVVVSDSGEIFSSPPSLNYQIGFNPLLTYTSVAGVLEAPNVPSLSGLEHVYIRIAQVSQYFKNSTNAFFNFDIPLYDRFTNICYYTEGNGTIQNYPLATSQYMNIGFFDVQLLNIFGTQVNLNGSDWSFVMEFEIA